MLFKFVILSVAVHYSLASSWGGDGDTNWGGDYGQQPSTGPPPPCGLGSIPVEVSETTTAELGQVVWQVSVEVKKGGKWAHGCGGVVIAKQAVLTSASCVEGQNPGMVRSESGIVDLPKGGFVRRRRFTFPGAQKPGLGYTEAIKVHPDYNKETKEHNLAVLRLATPFDFAKAEGNISYVCLPEDSAITLADQAQSLFFSGWGSQVGDNPTLRPKLQITPVQMANCTVSTTENEFCAAQQSDLKQCEGDLGGPLYTDNENDGSILLGIASRGSGCTEGDPLVYTDVFPYLEWIAEASKPYY